MEIVLRTFDRNMTLGTTRQAMVEEAQGEYISFVDDDDALSANYVSTIRPLLEEVDYIGFIVQTFQNGTPLLPAYHSLKYPQWNGDNQGSYRDFSHLNPIKRELARQGRYVGHGNEDVSWADSMRSLGIVKTESYVPEVMYFYFSRSPKNDSDYPGMHGENS